MADQKASQGSPDPQDQQDQKQHWRIRIFRLVSRKITKWYDAIDRMEPIELWKIFWGITAVIYAIFAVIFFVIRFTAPLIPVPFTDVGIPMEWIWALIVLFYTLNGITGTGENVMALKFFLGYWPVQEVRAQKICFVPPLIFTLREKPIELRNMELPGEPEQVWRGKDDKGHELPLGMGKDGKPVSPPKKIRVIDGKPVEVTLPWVQPIRTPFNVNDPVPVNTKEPLVVELQTKVGRKTQRWPDLPEFRKTPKYLTDDKGKVLKNDDGKPVPTDDPFIKRATTETVGVVVWIPRNLSNFLLSMKTVENAERIISDVVVAEMNAALQVGTLARMLANQELLGLYILKKIRERLGHEVVYEVKNSEGSVTESYEGHPKGETKSCRRGVEIVIFQLKAPNLSRDLNVAVQQILENRAKALAAEREGEGQRAQMALLQEYASKPGGQLMLALKQLETVRETIKPNDKVILVDGQNPVAPLLGNIPVIQQILAQNSGSPASPPPSKPT
jgi:hypothetical protein